MEALAGIRCLLEAQNARLAKLEHREPGLMYGGFFPSSQPLYAARHGRRRPFYRREKLPHDRHFLNAATTLTLHLDRGKLTRVADRENHRVQVFDGNGKYETQWKNLHRPCGLYMPYGHEPIC